MRELQFKLSSLLPFRFARSLANVNPTIINYHTVSDVKLPHITNLYSYRTIKNFRSDLDFFVQHYRLISLKDLLQSVRFQIKLPKNALLITFDDGLKEIYDYAAPILVEKGLTATFFLTTNFIDNKELGYDQKKSLLINHIFTNRDKIDVERLLMLLRNSGLKCNDLHKAIIGINYVNRGIIDEIANSLGYNFESFLFNEKPYVTTSQVQEMLRNGFSFGAHGTDHTKFSELSINDQVEQAISSTNIVSQKFDLPYKVFAFPYSDSNVSVNFFDRIKSYIELSFGTHGLLEDQVNTNYQRISVEKYNHDARIPIRFHYLRKFIYSIIGKDQIKRRSYQSD